MALKECQGFKSTLLWDGPVRVPGSLRLMGREHEPGQVPPPAAAHLGQRSVIPGFQEVVGDSEGLPMGADGRR